MQDGEARLAARERRRPRSVEHRGRARRRPRPSSASRRAGSPSARLEELPHRTEAEGLLQLAPPRRQHPRAAGSWRDGRPRRSSRVLPMPAGPSTSTQPDTPSDQVVHGAGAARPSPGHGRPGRAGTTCALRSLSRPARRPGGWRGGASSAGDCASTSASSERSAGSRVDAQLVGQGRAGPAQGRERVRLTLRAVQGQHQEPPPLLPQRVLGDQRLEVTHEQRGVAQLQTRLEQPFAGDGPELGQPDGLGLDPRLAGVLGVRRRPATGASASSRARTASAGAQRRGARPRPARSTRRRPSPGRAGARSRHRCCAITPSRCRAHRPRAGGDGAGG